MQQWIEWAKKIKAIAQTGQAYSTGPYDLERYKQLETIAHEMFAQMAAAPIGQVADFFVPDRGYATPKVDLRAGVFDGDRVLLVRERSDNRWSLPGGWADVGESPSEGIVREVREESGFEVTDPQLVAVIDRSLHAYLPRRPDHVYKLFFQCRRIGGAVRPNLEISEIDYFPVDALPELSVDRVLAADIERLHAWHRGEVRPVHVD
jgi:ADP-ribose pyrophosphatase YjhB (NUDIX family)